MPYSYNEEERNKKSGGISSDEIHSVKTSQQTDGQRDHKQHKSKSPEISRNQGFLGERDVAWTKKKKFFRSKNVST